MKRQRQAKSQNVQRRNNCDLQRQTTSYFSQQNHREAVGRNYLEAKSPDPLSEVASVGSLDSSGFDNSDVKYQ